MKLSESLFIAATSTWFSSDTDYSDSNTYYGVGSQSGSYDSSGLYTDVSVGNSWQLNRNYAMTPMVGLTHIWQQRDGYTVSSNNKTMILSTPAIAATATMQSLSMLEYVSMVAIH